MKILIIDHNGLQAQTRKMLLEDDLKCSVEVATTLGELHIVYKKQAFDLIVIDHTIENGQKCLEHILEIDPKQQILAVSNAIKCVITRCEDCINNHNIRRLNNPTPIRNISRMISGFRNYTCDHYDFETDKLPS